MRMTVPVAKSQWPDRAPTVRAVKALFEIGSLGELLVLTWRPIHPQKEQQISERYHCALVTHLQCKVRACRRRPVPMLHLL